MGDDYIKDKILEETLCHEAAHTSLDSYHSRAENWKLAQTADNQFISTYAKKNKIREDVAESFLVYLAVRHRRDRIDPPLAERIEQTIPNRIAYFDSLPLELTPLKSNNASKE